MPHAPQTTTDTARRLARLDRIADRLDTRYRIPGTPFRFGWDSILGLIPGAGDLITAGPAALFLLEGWRMGARKRVLARMTLNSAADLLIGGVPVLGDAFDLFFKANRRNLALLKAELAGRHDITTATKEVYDG